MPEPAIVVEGLRELQKSLRAVSSDLPKELRKANKAAADDVVPAAQRRAPSRTGKLRKSIVARAEQRGASVKGGGARVPYFGFIDFGNKIGVGGGVGRHDSHPRPFIKRGRIIYPAVTEKRDEILDTYERALAGLIRSAGLQD